MTKKIIATILAFALCIFAIGCAEQKKETSAADVKVKKRADIESKEIQFDGAFKGGVTAVISTDLGDITMIIYKDIAPQAAENFIGLAKEGYYDGQDFYRVVNDLLIQTGNAEGTSGKTIWGNIAFPVEYSAKLHHYSGAVGMVHPEGNPNENMSQFYIIATAQNSVDKTVLDKLKESGASEEVINTYKQAGGAPHLDNNYTVFGQITSGMEIIDKICAAKTEGDAPLEKVKLNSITISE